MQLRELIRIPYTMFYLTGERFDVVRHISQYLYHFMPVTIFLLIVSRIINLYQCLHVALTGLYINVTYLIPVNLHWRQLVVLYGPCEVDVLRYHTGEQQTHSFNTSFLHSTKLPLDYRTTDKSCE